MLPLRLVFGLLLLLTSSQLWAEPISLTFTAPDNCTSLLGIPGTALENRPGSFTLDLAFATELLPDGAPVRTLSTNAFPEALFSLTKALESRVVLRSKPLISERNVGFAIPEPAALILLGSGLAVLAALTKQRKGKSTKA